MEIRAVDIVHHSVSDLKTSAMFYRDTLGLSLELFDEDAGWAQFAIQPTTLVLLGATDDTPIPPGGGGVALSLSVDDDERATDELREKGITVLIEPFVGEACDMAVVGDPDENPVILHRRHDNTYGRNSPFP